MEAQKRWKVVTWKVVLSKQAIKDKQQLSRAGLLPQAEMLLEILSESPFRPPCEKLRGNLTGAFSRRISLQHRLVYHVLKDVKAVHVVRMWSHYE